MNEYTASNGITVRIDDVGDLDYHTKLGWAVLCGGKVVDALREFFRAEEDERLGRWRWPEDPDISVRPLNDRIVGVLRETREGRAYGQFGRNDHTHADPMSQAARAYFDAHPEPKPWHDAKEGEVWIITYRGEEYPAIFQADQFRDHGGSWDADSITAARRIWPAS